MKVSFLITLFLFQSFLFAQKADKKLQSTVQEAIAGFNGDIGIYVKNIRTGKTVSINADTIFPTASIVKVPIMTGIVYKLHTGELKYDSLFTYKDSLLYEGEDILGSFKSGEKIALKKLLMLMLTTSDNTASLWLQSIAGTGTRINQILDSLGFKDTRINSRTPGREANRAKYQWGQTTPKEMGILFEKIYRKEIFSAEACEKMMRILGRNFWDEDEAISQIPPTIEVFSKNGCVNASRSEAMIVNAPHNPYVFCIFTKNNKDQQWTHDNEAWVMARKLSKLLWDYFESQ
ncbi:MAG: serine hydrolase [Sphingobacteriales bacterium]|nr:serine hydrolase [Sphingobacteriales bacterium]